MTSLHRPKTFSDSEKARIESIKCIATAEATEAERMNLAAMWDEYRAEDWVGEALQTMDRIRKHQEKQRLIDQVQMEVVLSENLDTSCSRASVSYVSRGSFCLLVGLYPFIGRLPLL